MKKLRVSFIEFLNALPLGWGFLHGRNRNAFDVIFDVPSECSRHLAGGEADVGLIPVIESQRIEGLKVIPDISISTHKEVKSVLFVSQKPIHEVKSIAVDTSSRTSAALLQIIMAEFYSRDDIEYRISAPDIDRMLHQSDAALLIGNPALQLMCSPLCHVYDLAAEWYRFTGLPFVFAFWAVRADINLGLASNIFYESRREGLKSLEAIAEIYSKKLKIPSGEIVDYLSKNLDYSLEVKNLRGLDLFFRLTHKHRLIQNYRPIEFAL